MAADPCIGLSHIYTALILLVAGVSDALYREVEPPLWYVASKGGFILASIDAIHVKGLALESYAALIAVSIAPAAAAYILYRLCLLGGSDYLALGFIALSSPLPAASIPIPPALASLVAAAPLIALYYTWKLWYACGLACLRRGYARVKPSQAVYVGFYRWWIPRSRGGGEGCSIEDDPLEAARGKSFEATPGIPMVSLVAAGYIAYLALALAICWGV